MNEENNKFIGKDIADEAQAIKYSDKTDGGTSLITEAIENKKSYLESIKISEEWQRTFDHVSDSIFIQDKNFTIIKANKATLEMLRLAEKDVIGKKCFEVFHKSDKPWKNCPFEKTRLDKNSHTEEVYDSNISATLLVTTSPIFDENKNFLGSVHIAKNITEQKKLELLLQKKVEENQTIIDSVPALVFYKDKENNFIRTNKVFEDVMGKSKENLENKSVFELYPKEQAEAFWKDDLEVINSGKAKRTIVELARTSRGERIFQTDKVPYLDSHGEIKGVIGFSIDITERKKAEEALRESEERLKFHFENSPLAVVEWDASFIVTEWSKEAERIFGWKKEETIGRRIESLNIIHSEDVPIVTRTMEKLTSGKETMIVSSNRNITKSGKVIECTWYNSVLLDQNKQMKSVMSLVQDITDRKKNEAELRRLASFPELNINPITEVDLEGHILYQNPTMKKLFPDFETKGLNHHWLLDWGLTLESLIKGGAEKTDRELLVDKNYYHQTLHYLPEQKRVRIYGIDITERKKKEEELRKSEAKLQAEKNILNVIMKNTGASLAYLDRDFNFVAVNSIYCKINGRTEEELLGKNHFDFFPSEENRLLFEKARDTGQQIVLNQKPLVLKNQPWLEITYWDWTLTPVKNNEGYVYGLVISLIDVSERVKSIEDLKMHGHRLEQITTELKKVQAAVENASDIIFITDNKGKIIYINKATKNILGYKPKEFIGRKLNFWMEGMPNKFFNQMWKSIYFNKEPFVGEIQERKKDGELFTAEIRIAPVLGRDGQILSFVGIERDITEAKRLDSAKTEFISLAAHQLRTPITAISLTAEMLLGGLSGKMNEETEEYLYEIMNGVKKMSEMIELFLNVSRIEMKTFEVIPQPANIVKIIEDNIKSVLPQIKNKDLELRKNIVDDLPIVSVDLKIMDIVLENILSNAIKYTPSKGVIIVATEKYKDYILIKISDTGCGIPKKQQDKVFDKLFRADNTDKKIEGVGLGLYLCKSLIEQSGGKIWLTSEKDEGTTFYVSIPLVGMKRNSRVAKHNQ